MTFALIADNAGERPVTWMCEALEVSASGYYAWATRADGPTRRWRDELLGAIAEIHAEVRRHFTPTTTGGQAAGQKVILERLDDTGQFGFTEPLPVLQRTHLQDQ